MAGAGASAVAAFAEPSTRGERPIVQTQRRVLARGLDGGQRRDGSDVGAALGSGGAGVRIEVEDRGPGIPEEFRP